MNRVISDTAEYGCYLFAYSCVPLLENFMQAQGKDVMGAPFNEGKSNRVDNRRLIEVNAAIRQHPVEEIGAWLRSRMRGMKQL